jgi:serine/threonine-protein kinase
LQVGNYTLSDLLGRGGTSEVYAAEHRFLGDTVAVKLLRRALVDEEHIHEEFVAEAARTREIQHPNVVRVIDFGHDDTHGCYLVMERIDGESLAARLRRVGRIEEAALRELAAAIADGMQAAHARGIVHRDLKPGNVMLRGDVPTIVDFGIAKSLGNTSVAVTERRVGTVAYMAPEQLVDGLITPAVDIWALGVILYEAATGQAPFSSFSDGRLPQLFESPPPPRTLAAISPALDHLILRCLERDPGKRPASMAAVARALRDPDGERVTEDIGPPGPRRADAALLTVVETALPEGVVVARRRTRWLVIAACVIAAAVVAVALLVVRGDEPDPRATATRGAGTIPADVAPRITPPPEPPPVASPPTAAQPSAAAQPPPAAQPPAVASPPAVAPAPANRPTSRPTSDRKRVRPAKQRTTSQGETLD